MLYSRELAYSAERSGYSVMQGACQNGAEGQDQAEGERQQAPNSSGTTTQSTAAGQAAQQPQSQQLLLAMMTAHRELQQRLIAAVPNGSDKLIAAVPNASLSLPFLMPTHMQAQFCSAQKAAPAKEAAGGTAHAPEEANEKQHQDK